VDTPTVVKPFKMSVRFKAIMFALIAFGLISFSITYSQDTTRAWVNYLMGSVFFLSLGLGGLFFVALQNVTSARWSVVIRRVAEAMSLTLPVAALLIFILYLGAHNLYEWTHEEVVAKDPILHGKSAFLNYGFFGLRLLAYFLIWIASAFYMARNSIKQDKSGDVDYTHKNKKYSAPILVLFGLTVSFAGFDLLMSLEPHWFSTIFGIYFFAGLFQAGLAMLYVLCWLLYRSGVLKGFVTMDHFHDINRMLFGFSVFWAYIGFSQYLLIWYAALPEEMCFYVIRSQQGWEWISLGLLFVRFIFPFFAFTTFKSKRNFKWGLIVSGVVLFGQWLDIFWVAQPAMRLMHHGELHGPHIGLVEIGVGLGALALFCLAAGFVMQRIQMVAIKDPRLELSTDYYHHYEEGVWS